MKQILSLFLLGLFLTACGGGSSSTDTSDNAPVNVDQNELITLVNQIRTSNQMCGDVAYTATNEVQWNGILAIVAQNHSDDMNNNNFLAHTSSDGKTLSDRLGEVGYSSVNYAGENIAQGYTTEQSVIDAWLANPEHCANLMNPNYGYMGIATAGAYWTQVFTN